MEVSMGNWTDTLNEITSAGSTYDIFRKKYLEKLSDYTGRNAIAYYSGWLQKNPARFQKDMSINDDDMNGFMTVVHNLDTSKGLT